MDLTAKILLETSVQATTEFLDRIQNKNILNVHTQNNCIESARYHKCLS